ncbi:MAG: RNA polymerase sigma factor [Pyrinomonadaceae bacterium]
MSLIPTKSFVSRTTQHTSDFLAEGTRRILARAKDSRALDVSALSARTNAALQKYLLRDLPDATASQVNEFFDGIHADDLCLIAACERGDEAAWLELIEKYGAMVRAVARSVSASEDKAEDLAQSIWAELHGLRLREDGKTHGKLGYYSGRGSLGGWLQAIVRQLAVDVHRKESKLVQTETDADFDSLARDNGNASHFNTTHASPDPEQSFAAREFAETLEHSLARAINELTAEDRLLIKLYYFDKLSLREAGALLCVHEATASRRLTRLHKDLRARLEAILTRDCGWSQAEASSALTNASANLEIDLESLLKNKKAAGKE